MSEEIKTALEAVVQAAKRMAETSTGGAPRRGPDNAPSGMGTTSPLRHGDERADEEREEEIDYGDVMT